MARPRDASDLQREGNSNSSSSSGGSFRIVLVTLAAKGRGQAKDSAGCGIAPELSELEEVLRVLRDDAPGGQAGLGVPAARGAEEAAVDRQSLWERPRGRRHHLRRNSGHEASGIVHDSSAGDSGARLRTKPRPIGNTRDPTMSSLTVRGLDIAATQLAR